MPNRINTQNINGQDIDIFRYDDVCAVYAWPRERTLSAVTLKVLGVFETEEEAKKFVDGLK